MREDDIGSSAGAAGPLQVLKDEGRLTKTGVTNPRYTPAGKPEEGSGAASDVVDFETKVVQFSILYDGDEEKFAHLWALRDVMHRVLNVAFGEWRRAERVPSKTNQDKEALDRGQVTAAVKALLVRENEYWSKQLPLKLAAVEKLRVNLGSARAKNKDVDKALELMRRAETEVRKIRTRAEIQVPSSIYDAAVRFTQQRLAIYRKAEFRGERGADSFTYPSPIRWRDSSWIFDPHESKRGQYVLTLELGKDGKKVDRRPFDVLPDGPSAHAQAKRMLEEGAKLCDARVVYVDHKKQWFAKLTVRLPRKSARAVEGTTATLRRGVHSALVLCFEDGRVRTITGNDVLWFKRKIKARKVQAQEHARRLEAGPAAMIRGKKKRYKKLLAIGAAEDRFVDWRCKTWACAIAAELSDRGVSKLLVASMGTKDMVDGNDVVQALLYQWPFARLLGWIVKACEAIPVDEAGRAIRAKFNESGIVELVDGRRVEVGFRKIEVEEFDSAYNARRCPEKKCRHMHDKRQEGTFKCEVCGFERPADQIVAWNGLIDAVGEGPLEKAKKREKAVGAALKKGLKGE